MKARLFQNGALAVALLFICPLHELKAGETQAPWRLARTRNFTILSRQHERDARRTAVRLQQVRDALRTTFPAMFGAEDRAPDEPTTVILFPDDAAYAPFKPTLGSITATGIAGHFQSSPETNYIAVPVVRGNDELTFQTVLHEYVHQISGYYFRHAPIWFREGVSEYYSTAQLSSPNRLTLGASIRASQRSLRGGMPVPLRSLITITESSPAYVDNESRALMYAESWALVHFFLNGGDEDRRAQFARFLELLSIGEDANKSFREVFGSSLDTLEAQFDNYIRTSEFSARKVPLDEPVGRLQTLEVTAPGEGEVNAHLGDMLLRAGRDGEAEPLLESAVVSAPQFAPLHVSLGLLKLRQNRLNEAKSYLTRAIELDSTNALARFHLAEALNREGVGGGVTPAEFDETTRLIREELKRAIELRPQFLEAYRLLAFIELERGDNVEEASTMIETLVRRFPSRFDLRALLAQVKIRTRDYDRARYLLTSVKQRVRDKDVLAQVERLQRLISNREEDERRELAETKASRVSPDELQPCDMPEPGPYHKRLRFKGSQACGQLVEIDCESGGVVLLVQTEGRTLRLRGNTLNRVRFVTYTTAVKTGQLTCGPRTPANPVLVTYNDSKDAATGIDGDVIAVEFVPVDWKP